MLTTIIQVAGTLGIPTATATAVVNIILNTGTLAVRSHIEQKILDPF